MLAECCDRGVIEAEVMQYLVRMLARLRRRATYAPRCARQLDRLAHNFHVTQHLVLHMARDVEVFHLRICKHFVHPIDWPTWHAGLVQKFDPCRGRTLASDRADCLVQPATIF